MTQAGACLFAEVGRSAKGGAAFKTREEARFRQFYPVVEAKKWGFHQQNRGFNMIEP